MKLKQLGGLKTLYLWIEWFMIIKDLMGIGFWHNFSTKLKPDVWHTVTKGRTAIRKGLGSRKLLPNSQPYSCSLIWNCSSGKDFELVRIHQCHS